MYDIELIKRAVQAAIVALFMWAYCMLIAPEVAKALGG